MSYIVVDVEGDGDIGINSMVCFGAVLIDSEGELDKTFYGQTAPISDEYNPEALAVSGFSRKEHEAFPHHSVTMHAFNNWVLEHNKGRATLVSDNNGYDASWMTYYFALNKIKNPFGWTFRRIGDMYAGFMNDTFYQWKKHRTSKHTHHPVDDAKGNAEALIYLKNQCL